MFLAFQRQILKLKKRRPDVTSGRLYPKLCDYTYANISFPDYGVERNNLARGAVYFFTFLFLATPLIMGYFYRLGTGILLALAEALIAYAFFNYVEPMLQLGKQEKPAE